MINGVDYVIGRRTLALAVAFPILCGRLLKKPITQTHIINGLIFDYVIARRALALAATFPILRGRLLKKPITQRAVCEARGSVCVALPLAALF